MAYKNKFDQPYYLKADDNTPEMNDILSIGKEGDLFKLKKVSLIKKIPVNVSDSNNNNLFHLILKDDLKKTQTNIINFFKYLINNNTNPEQPNFQNRTPLHYACMNHYTIIIKYLLDIGCNPNFKDNFGMTPMHYYMGGKIKLYKDKSPKPFKNYKNNLNIKTNKDFASLHREVHDFISDEYSDYFMYFNKIIVSITAQDKKYANDITRIVEALDGNVSDVTSREDRTKELLTRAKKIRSIFEGAIVNVFNPKEIGGNIIKDTIIKRYNDKTNNIYPKKPDTAKEKCEHFYIFDDFNLSVYLNSIIEGFEYDSILVSLDLDDPNELKNILDSILKEIKLFIKNDETPPPSYRIENKIGKLTKLFNDSINKTEENYELFLELTNDIIELFNNVNRIRLIIDLVGLDSKGKSDGNDINVKINNFYSNYLPKVFYDEADEKLKKEESNNLKQYRKSVTGLPKISDLYEEFNIDIFDNEYKENNVVKSLGDLKISDIINQNKESINKLLEFFIKKIVHQFDIKEFFKGDNETKSKEINAFEKKISDIYDKTITFHDDYCNIKELNKKKLLIGVITEVVTNHLATMVNNTINRLTISMMSSDTIYLTDLTNILDIVDDDNIVFDFRTDMNDITFNIEKDDSKKIEKKFIMFSDDYSILEIEKELLELKIDIDTFTHMLLKGATINEKDGNGRLPLDNIIDNKYYCIVDKYTEYGYKYNFMNHADRIPSTLKYALKSLVNHVKSYNFASFTDNQYKDLKELIESSGDDYGFQMYKANKGSFEEINKHGRLIITNHIMISALKLPLGIYIDRYNLGKTLELDKYEMGSINNLEEKISLISNKITLLEEIYKKCIEYFTGSKYHHTNTLKGDLYKLLYNLSKDIIKTQIELFIKKMITGYYTHNSTSSITLDQLNNIFSAGSMIGKSLNDNMDRIMGLFIKNACQLFEDEDEKDSHVNRTAGDILGDFIDEFSLNSYVAIKPDSKLMKLLKKNVVGYFDNFVYRMLQNWMIVYENNLKFIINHYRLLKIIYSITS